ncbi:MAG: alpha/beta hydrolase [Azospirillaceae bacterium]|nr:alpha/beta hydrolase [Azospirillaceae bacterium]
MTQTAESPLTEAGVLSWTQAPGITEGDVVRAGGRIHYVALGPADGEPLVLMPKVGGWAADWRQVALALADRFRILIIDPPGHGGSVMAGSPPYLQSTLESAAMIMAALDELGVERFNVAGNSLGGCIAIAMAALWPDAVKRLALVSVSLADRYSREELAKQDAAVRDQFDANGVPLPRTAAQTARFASFDPRVEAEQALSRARAGAWVRPTERGVGRMGISGYLHRIQAPTLLVYGDRGFYTKYEEVGRRLIPNVTIDHMADAGSFLHQEKPAETAAMLRAFLTA